MNHSGPQRPWPRRGGSATARGGRLKGAAMDISITTETPAGPHRARASGILAPTKQQVLPLDPVVNTPALALCYFPVAAVKKGYTLRGFKPYTFLILGF